MSIPDELRNIRDHLRSGRYGQHEVWEQQLEKAATEIEQLKASVPTEIAKGTYALAVEIARLRASSFEVVQLQPDDDCPGLWIGFKTGEDRDEAMKLFTIATLEHKP